jgi:hypothetical protein
MRVLNIKKKRQRKKHKTVHRSTLYTYLEASISYRKLLRGNHLIIGEREREEKPF